MVKSALQSRLAFALSALFLTSCHNSEKANSEAADLNMMDGTLNTLSSDVVGLLGNGAITNIQLLKTEYNSRFHKRPPLFFSKPLKPVFPRDSEYQLPDREYFWLKEWSKSDPLTTPLFWSYFYVPNAMVSYMTVEGREKMCSSNDFHQLVAPLSNRVERAQPEPISNVGEPKTKN